MVDILLICIGIAFYIGTGVTLMAAVQEKINGLCVLFWPIVLVGGLILAFFNWCARCGRAASGKDVANNDEQD